VRDREPGYLIEGRLEGVLGELTGYEMWIWGISGEPGGEYSSITVEGYEMIGKGD
jgi:hypothetical protein